MLNKGKYFIGDLSDIMPLEEWSLFIDRIFKSNLIRKRSGIDRMLGKTFGYIVVDNTKDSFETNIDFTCETESKIIGVINIQYLSKEDKIKFSDNLIDFYKDFDISIDDNGDAHIGNLIINTKINQ